MPKKEVSVDYLANYLPMGAAALVIPFLTDKKVHLTIARERTTVLGNYRSKTAYQNHRISVNGNLNPYSFLITLLHELAHLTTYEQFGNRVQSHGVEWKKSYQLLMQPYLLKKIFPADVEQALLQSLRNPAASSCADVQLQRVLRNYEVKKGILVEEVPGGSLFSIKDGRVFKKGERLRKRYKCIDVTTGALYLFSPVYEVNLI